MNLKRTRRSNPVDWDGTARPAENGPGLFVVGTDTGVGKTWVAARIAQALVKSGHLCGVYKPAASGCQLIGGEAISDDAVALWKAAGKPGSLAAVCPQRFLAPLAPHLAARQEGKEIDARLLRSGLSAWQDYCGIVVVEGAGGLMSPIGDQEYIADLAADFGFPLVIVAPNKIGVINQVLQTLMAARHYCDTLRIAGIVLNDVLPSDAYDPSVTSNRTELERHCDAPILAHLAHGATEFPHPVDWALIARG